MEKQVKTQKMLRQRKFLAVLPLLALPFLTFIFWSLGGGKGTGADEKTAQSAGFNIKLPDARLKEDEEMDKMSYYNRAKQDSIKFQELIKNDPNYRNSSFLDSSRSQFSQGSRFFPPERSGGINASVYGSSGYNDPNSQKIYEKLALLNRELDRPIRQPQETALPYGSAGGAGKALEGSDVDRLQQMMEMMSQSDGEDPEMQQLNGMLEKILDIQHPGRAQQKIKQVSDAKRGQVFMVSDKPNENVISMLDKKGNGQLAGFYPLEDAVADETQNAIKAVVHESQTIVNGSTVKLRLLSDITVNSVLIPKDNFLYGTASLKGERLGIVIESIRYKNSLFPVDLQVYDMDGMDGIQIPGAITRDVAKQSADRSLQALGMGSLDPSLEMQAAGAGIEAVKSLVSKKVKLVKVMVKAGYQVLLRDEKQKQD